MGFLHLESEHDGRIDDTDDECHVSTRELVAGSEEHDRGDGEDSTFYRRCGKDDLGDEMREGFFGAVCHGGRGPPFR